jgi:hypothetical protein
MALRCATTFATLGHQATQHDNISRRVVVWNASCLVADVLTEKGYKIPFRTTTFRLVRALSRQCTFKGQNDPWLEEARLLHRDERGLLVKEGDDAVSASRYALMGLRHGRTGSHRDFNRPIEAANLGVV